jgi:hypothetical protein
MEKKAASVGELLEFENPPMITRSEMKWVYIDGMPRSNRYLILTTRLVEEDGEIVEYGYECLGVEQRCRVLDEVLDHQGRRYVPTGKEIVIR